MKLSTMKASRFVKAFEAEVDHWERTLSHILEVVEMLLTVQRQWMYLEVCSLAAHCVPRDQCTLHSLAAHCVPRDQCAIHSLAAHCVPRDQGAIHSLVAPRDHRYDGLKRKTEQPSPYHCCFGQTCGGDGLTSSLIRQSPCPTAFTLSQRACCVLGCHVT